MTVSSIIEEGMVIHKMYDEKRRKERVYELLEMVGLNREHANRFPPRVLRRPAPAHRHCPGPGHRAGIHRLRRAHLRPGRVHPVQVINLLHDLQEKLGLTYLFIAHDLNIVKYISDRIAVMYLGNVVELASSDELYKNTLHPYSQALLSAVPIPDPSAEAQKHRIIISGDVPSPINTPKGCNFAGRCPKACDQCKESKLYVYLLITPGHYVACHLVQPQKK